MFSICCYFTFYKLGSFPTSKLPEGTIFSETFAASRFFKPVIQCQSCRNLFSSAEKPIKMFVCSSIGCNEAGSLRAFQNEICFLKLLMSPFFLIECRSAERFGTNEVSSNCHYNFPRFSNIIQCKRSFARWSFKLENGFLNFLLSLSRFSKSHSPENPRNARVSIVWGQSI